MMRVWKLSYAQPVRWGGAGAFSTGAHAVLIAAWVSATLPSPSLPANSLANRVYYLPPPDKPRVVRGSSESIRYVIQAPGEGAGPGPMTQNARAAITPPERSADPGMQRADSTRSTPRPVDGAPNGDSVFTILEVDTAVVRSQTSAAPAYPLDLLEKKIEGTVLARYIVDTTGFADTASFEVIRATHPGFVRAVREVLPYMRFAPAKIGPQRVRQLVEQPFTFKITPALLAAPAKP